MAGLKTIYGKLGRPLADIRVPVTRSSLINDIGEAVFNISTADVKCREDLLRYGNKIYIQDDVLPDWIGMIDTPRAWKNGYVEVHAYEMPYILQYRLPPLNQVISGAPGVKFSTLLGYANAKEDTLLRVGSVFGGGNDYQENLTDTIYSHLKTIAEINGCEWATNAEFDAQGLLTVKMNWMEKGGVPTDLEISQGKNLTYGDSPLDEAGEIINSVEGVSDIESETGTGTISETYTVPSVYGLREARVSFSGIADKQVLLYNAQMMVEEKMNPKFGAPITVINQGGTYSQIRLRNIIRYTSPNVGFTTGGLGASMDVRILGYLYNESTDTCEIFTGEI